MNNSRPYGLRSNLSLKEWIVLAYILYISTPYVKYVNTYKIVLASNHLQTNQRINGKHVQPQSRRCHFSPEQMGYIGLKTPKNGLFWKNEKEVMSLMAGSKNRLHNQICCSQGKTIINYTPNEHNIIVNSEILWCLIDLD